MKFGIIFANAGPASSPNTPSPWPSWPRRTGFDSLWTVEHVLVPADYESQYPYSPQREDAGPARTSPIPDPLVWLTYVGGGHPHIKLATGILILPQRNPLVLAKEVATLDVLSGGRVMLGVGVGWLREEFDAIGVPFDERARPHRRVRRGPADAVDARTSRRSRAGSPPSSGPRASPSPSRARCPIVVGGHTKPPRAGPAAWATASSRPGPSARGAGRAARRDAAGGQGRRPRRRRHRGDGRRLHGRRRDQEVRRPRRRPHRHPAAGLRRRDPQDSSSATSPRTSSQR